MKIITLKRIAKDTQDGTFGVWIMDDGFPYFVSIELSWRNNATDISRIPAGEYLCVKKMSAKFNYQVFELQDVPNRANIEIHIANSVKDILGCIGVASRFGVVETKDAGQLHGVLESSIAFNQFMAMLKNDDQIKLIIVDA